MKQIIDKKFAIYHYEDGVLHNEEGPAISWSDGRTAYYIRGMQVAKSDWEAIYKIPTNSIKR